MLPNCTGVAHKSVYSEVCSLADNISFYLSLQHCSGRYTVQTQRPDLDCKLRQRGLGSLLWPFLLFPHATTQL